MDNKQPEQKILTRARRDPWTQPTRREVWIVSGLVILGAWGLALAITLAGGR